MKPQGNEIKRRPGDIDVSEVVGLIPGVREVTYDYVHPETGWESAQPKGAWAQGWVFTPRLIGSASRERRAMLLNAEDSDKVDHLDRTKGTHVVDMLTDQHWRAFRVPCALVGCMCDAAVEPIYGDCGEPS